MTEPRIIPETIEGLTPEWLNSVLTETGVLTDQRVTGTASQMLGEDEGFVGEIFRITPTYDSTGSAPQSFVVKIPKLANRAMGELLGAYERENMFYMTFGDTLPIRTPTLYFGDFDRDVGSENQEKILRQADKIPKFLNGVLMRLSRWIAANKKRRYILLIEDINQAHPGNQIEGATRERCAIVMQAIAKLHAWYWEHDSLQNQFWLLPMNIDTRMRHEMMKGARPAFDAQFPEVVENGLGAYLDRVAADGIGIMYRLCEGPTTLLHCDLRLDNLFFDDEGVIFIDWQLVRKGPPAYDIAYYLSSALNDYDSAEELLRVYHRALVAEGVSAYTFSQLKTDYALALQSVLMTLATVDQVDVGSGRGSVLLRKWMQRLLQRLNADAGHALT